MSADERAILIKELPKPLKHSQARDYVYGEDSSNQFVLQRLAGNLLRFRTKTEQYAYIIGALKNLPAGLAANLVMTAATEAGLNSYACIALAASAGSAMFVIPSAIVAYLEEYFKRRNFPEALAPTIIAFSKLPENVRGSNLITPSGSGASSYLSLPLGLQSHTMPMASAGRANESPISVGVVGLNSDFTSILDPNANLDSEKIATLNAAAKKGSYPWMVFGAGRELLGIFIVFSVFLKLADLTSLASQKISDFDNPHARHGIEISVNLYLKTLLVLMTVGLAYLVLGLGLRLPIRPHLPQIAGSLSGFAVAGVINPTGTAAKLLTGPVLATVGAALPKPTAWVANRAVGTAKNLYRGMFAANSQNADYVQIQDKDPEANQAKAPRSFLSRCCT